jgi:hypothetical protein
LELGNTKEANRKIKALLEKGDKKMHPVERLSYRAVEMYVMDKSHRKLEAVQSAKDIIKEILDANINDSPLLEMLDQILQEMHLYDNLL